MPEPLDEAARAFVERDLPVFVLDACAVLDVVRAPVLPANSGGIVAASLALRDAAVSLAIPEQAHVEFSQNLRLVVEATERDLQRTHQAVAAWRDVSAALGASAPAPAREFDRALLAGLLDAATALEATAHVLATDLHALGQARARNAAGRAPARRGHDNFRDCDIFEHSLALARTLRTSGFERSIVFVSSNTGDYGMPTSPKHDVGGVLGDLGIAFVTNLAWAVAHLRDAPGRQ